MCRSIRCSTSLRARATCRRSIWSNDRGGLAVGVLHAEHPEDWKAAQHMHARARVENLAPPDFTEGAPMRRILTLAVEILGKRVALRRLALEAGSS